MPNISNISTIPLWYTEDWAPAQSRWEWPQMTWQAIESTVADGLLVPKRKAQALNLFRTLWLESETLMPMDLLQKFLVVSALAYNPARGTPERVTETSLKPASGLLPRWGFTDLEVALSYTWSGTALLIAQERHHDLLERRGESLTAEQAVRLVILLTAGLPVSSQTERDILTPPTSNLSRAA